MKISMWITLIILALKLQQANLKIQELEEQKEEVLDKAIEAIKKLEHLSINKPA